MLVTNIAGVSPREKTRAALQQAALELFAEHGYDATPTAAIAARAGVSEMTLFRHFRSKSAFLVEDPYDPLIAAAVRDRPAHEPPLKATVRGIRDAWQAVAPPDAEEVRLRLRIVAETPGLRAAMTTGSEATEHAIVTALTERGTPPLDAAIAAAAVVAALNSALLAWSRGDDPDISTALGAAFRVLGED